MDRGFGGALLHLHFAGAAFCRADLEWTIAHGGDEIEAGTQTGAIVLAADAPHAGDAAAAFFESLNAEPGNEPHQVFGRSADSERS